jgi:translation initiation factor IF-2
MKEEKIKENIVSKPTVVVVLGHIDHGKSSLLEAIKDFKITEKESGGITQHIGAYEIEHEGKKIAFIDTPGHEAFSAMRSRGTKMADIAILVISAEEGVKTQTKEALSHIKNFAIPLVIAINKIDKPQANPEKVKRELIPCDIIVESQGGKIPCVEISAKTKQGISELLDLILLIAEMEELKTDLSAGPEGVIIESYMDNKRGPMATIVLKQGILKLGDTLGTSSTFGKIKILENFQRKPIKETLPGLPAIILGFEKVPQAGELFKVFPNVEAANQNIKKENNRTEINHFEESEKKIMNIILKTDVSGSLEAIEGILKNLPWQEGMELRILKSGVGEIGEEDLKLAQLTKAKILGFKVKTNPQALQFAQLQKIKIMNFDIIYDLMETVKTLMEKETKPKEDFREIGRIKVLAIFKKEKNRQVVGGKVIDGEVIRGAKIEVLKNKEEKGKEGKLVGLQRNKRVIDKVKKGDECGILFEGDVEINEGDILVIKIYG